MFVEIQREYLNPDKMLLPFILCDFGRNPEQGEVHRQKGFPYHHLLWVTKGRGIFNLSGETFLLEEGAGLFCKRDIPHSYKNISGDFKTAWITFLCPEEIFEYYSVSDWASFDETTVLEEAYEELDSLCAGSSNVLSRSAAGYMWITRWLANTYEPSASIEQRVLQFLENHFSEPLTLEYIAKNVHLDKYALCHYYKKQCGISVMEQLKKIRIAKAKQLLRYNHQHRIEKIGIMCGYESPSYFGKVFRSETGITPKEYQEIHRK